VHAKPGVTPIIIGARRLSQFEDDIRALDVTLTAEEVARLDAITEPTLGFPQSMQPMARGGQALLSQWNWPGW
jgi:diketogulonate reductase-like aldo/keto reductase